MEHILDFELLNTIKKKNKHDVGNVMDVLPFLSKRTKVIRNKFYHALGEYVRKTCEVKLSEINKKSEYEDNPFIEQLIENIEYEEDDEFDLKRLLEQFLFNNQNQINPVHPYLFNYIPIIENENEINKYAQFMRDVFTKEDQNLKGIFSDVSTEDILTELVIANLDDLKHKEYPVLYKGNLPSLSKLYREDLKYLSEHKDYFLKVFPLLTHFYTFMYCCQLILKFENYDLADYGKLDPLYFGLEWESLNKRRKPVDDLEGFKRIKERSINIFVHIHTMSHLSYNLLNEITNDRKRNFMNYVDVMDLIKRENMEEVFLEDLKIWINEYSEWKEISDIEVPNNLSDAFRAIFNSLQKGMSSDVCLKYGQNIEDLGSTLFLKNRGSLGQTLNINHETLLMLTAICVKDQRIPLNTLFEEFEKRGIKFDRYSKKEIIDVLDSQNLIDKKSDSGDAQYVKPIL